ncbi:MAG: hypothetical protein HC923_10510 [Myxococcales bacterium]|nr:hypothetical protein [Myxococcales bacterium]
MATHDELPAALKQLRNGALGAVVLGLILCAITLLQDPTSFFRSYLFGYMFVLSFPLGCLGLLFLHHLVAGSWGFIIQRFLEAGAQSLWLMVLFFVPVAAGAGHLYHWMDASAVAHDPVLSAKAPYLNYGFWMVRAVVYFVSWLVLAAFALRYSKQQDATGHGVYSNRLIQLSAGGLVVYFLTMTFAAFDWAMSLEPHWFSTIYGLIFVEGQGLTALAFCLVILSFARRAPALGA